LILEIEDKVYKPISFISKITVLFGMKRNNFLYLTFGFFCFLACPSVNAQTSLKYKTLCKTWVYESVEAKISFPIDTTIIYYSRSWKVDTTGISKARRTFHSNGEYSSVSKEGKPSTANSKWELSDNESNLSVYDNKGKKEKFAILRLNPDYLELSIKKKGIKMVLKMIPE
jgi:hypothetical protein